MRLPEKSTCYLEKLKKNIVSNGNLDCPIKFNKNCSACLIFSPRGKNQSCSALRCLQIGTYAEVKPALLAKSTSFKKGNKLRAVGSIVLELHFVKIICLNQYKDNIQNP